MQLSKILVGLGVIASAFSVVRCGKLGLAPGMTGLTFQGTTPSLSQASRGIRNVVASEAEIPVYRQDGQVSGKLVLTKAQIVLKEVKFKKQETESRSSDDTIRFRGPYVVDLLTNVVTPAPQPIALEAGAYRKIEMKLAKPSSSQSLSDDAMREKSVYLAGKYSGETASGVVTDIPFEASYDFEESFVIRGQNALVIETAAPNPIVIAFRLERWLKWDDAITNGSAIDFSEAILTDGELKLSSKSQGNNRKIWQTLRRGILHSIAQGKDQNDDGVLTTEESDDHSNHIELGDDHSEGAEPGDDNSIHTEVGDDHSQKVEPGDDNSIHNEVGDDH